MTEPLCSWCGQPLIETDFNTKFYVYLCDNDRCRLFRRPQDKRSKYPEPEVQGRRKETELPSYPATRARARANYRTARLLGIECREAVDYRSNKRLNELLKRSGKRTGDNHG